MTLGARKLVALLLTWVTIWSAGAAQAGALATVTAALPEPPPPPQGSATWVARSMRLNGLAMTVQTFASQLQPDAVLHHYERWSRRLAHVQTRRLVATPWLVLAVAARDCHVTIQARPTGSGSEGTITVSVPPQNAELRTETRFPRPTSTTVVNWQEYDDQGVLAEHISMESRRSPAVEAHAYAQALTAAGWRLIRNARGAADPRAYVIEAQKGAEHAMLTLAPDQTRAGAAVIVVVWKKS